MNELITIRQAAELLGLPCQTLRRMADRKHVRCRRLPGTFVRRFDRADLIAFCLENGLFRQADLLGHQRCLLGVGLEDTLANALVVPGRVLHRADSLLEAGLLVEAKLPSAVAVDFRLGRDHCLEAGRYLAKQCPFAKTVALVYGDEMAYPFHAGHVYHEVLVQPVNPAKVMDALEGNV